MIWEVTGEIEIAFWNYQCIFEFPSALSIFSQFFWSFFRDMHESINKYTCSEASPQSVLKPCWIFFSTIWWANFWIERPEQRNRRDKIRLFRCNALLQLVDWNDLKSDLLKDTTQVGSLKRQSKAIHPSIHFWGTCQTRWGFVSFHTRNTHRVSFDIDCC